jgi:hypothetical protein
MAAIAPDLPRRGTRRRCAAISLLLSLAAAPLAAQSARLVAMNVARPYLEDERPFVPGTVSVPGNVAVPDNLRPTVATMLRDSSTFRRQCARLARASDLDVTVQRILLPESATGGAFTRIVRRADGTLEADVRIDALGDSVLLIAHEFEHILEQLDGVDLAAMAARTDTGVSERAADGQFETERAVAAGRRVAQEVHAAARRQ